jgi:hypothetical protein
MQSLVRSTAETLEAPDAAPAQTPTPPAPTPSAENGPRPAAAPPRRRKRHWLLRILFTVIVLLLVAAVAIQLVLWSNLPKRLVLSQLQSQLGLRVQAASLTTGWLGDTNLRDVTLALPMAEQSFLDMPKMRVKHTTLFGLILRRPVSVDLIALENPTLYVRRNAAGRWNLAEVSELIARAVGKKPADESARQSRPKLPEVIIDRATVVITDTNGSRTDIKPLNLHGRPDPNTPGILWRYDMEVPDHVKFVGKLAPGAPWAHEVKFAIDNINQWAQPWVAQFPPDARVAAQWRGKLDSAGRLNARLDVEELKASNMAAKGVVTIADLGDGAFALNPDGLLLTTPQKAFPEAKVASGNIAIDSKGIRIERLQLAAVGGQMRVDGNYAFATATGQLAADWTDVATGAVTHSGSLQAQLTAPFPERPKLDVTLTARGTTPDGPFDAKLILGGTGRRGWLDMDWTLTAPSLDWRGNQPLRLDGLIAKIETRQDPKSHESIVRLAHLQSPGNHVEGIGEYNLSNGNWKFWINLGTAPLGGAETIKQAAAGTGAGQGQSPPPMSAMLNAWGDPKQVRIEQLLLRGAEAELWAEGWYVYHRPSPLDLNVYVKHIPPRRDEQDRPPIYGFVKGQAHIKGTAFQPRNLTIEGELNGEGVTAYKRPVKDIKVKVSGFANNDRAELKSEQFEALKAHWSLDAAYTANDRALTIGVRVPDLDLRELEDLLRPLAPDDRQTARKDEPRPGPLSGKLDGQWTINVFRPAIDRVRVKGGFKATDVRAAKFVADQVEATTTLEDGVLTIGPIALRRSATRAADGSQVKIDGRGEASLRLDTADVSQIQLSLSLANWPLQLADSAWVDLSGGSQKLVLDLASKPDAKQKYLTGKTLAGDLQLTSQFTYGGRALGDGELRATFTGREIDLRTIRLNTLDGNLHGQGVIELEKPLEARGSLEWEKVSSARLVEFFPGLKGLEGTFTGTVRVQPSVDPRALAPLAVAIEFAADKGRYKTIEFGRGRVLAYADVNRFVINDPGDIPSTIEVAGGLLSLWGRVSYHNLETTKDAISSQMILHFKGLDLNQVVRAASPEFKQGAGKLDGTLTIIGATRGPRLRPLPPGAHKPGFVEKLITAFTAEGDIKLTEAKLGPLPIFSNLYDLMSLGQDVKQNNGRGQVSVRMEGGSLELNNLHYFNRGTEVRALLTIDRLWELPTSPVRGNAVGSSRPLASLQLPFIAEADRVLALLQNDLISVDISGPLNHPKVEQILLKDVARAMQNMLLGEVGNVKGDARKTSR